MPSFDCVCWKIILGFGNLNFNYNNEDQPYYTTKEILEGAYNVYDRMQDVNYYPNSNEKGYFSNTFDRMKRARDRFLFNLDFVSKKVSHFIKNANFLSFMKTNKENENNYSLGETNDYSTDEYNIHNEIHASSYDSYSKHSFG
ncbi:hypothetical protein Avbf_17925 [Armadillidium vulgare]|nr:hypothetical protein Avbf_17925 [Armadillidium vulgare]